MRSLAIVLMMSSFSALAEGHQAAAVNFNQMIEESAHNGANIDASMKTHYDSDTMPSVDMNAPDNKAVEDFVDAELHYKETDPVVKSDEPAATVDRRYNSVGEPKIIELNFVTEN
jgi:hemerythrin superfamily protein